MRWLMSASARSRQVIGAATAGGPADAGSFLQAVASALTSDASRRTAVVRTKAVFRQSIRRLTPDAAPPRHRYRHRGAGGEAVGPNCSATFCFRWSWKSFV